MTILEIILKNEKDIKIPKIGDKVYFDYKEYTVSFVQIKKSRKDGLMHPMIHVCRETEVFDWLEYHDKQNKYKKREKKMFENIRKVINDWYKS